MKFQLIYCFWFLLLAPISDSLDCIPKRCRFEDVLAAPDYEIQEKGNWKRTSLFCEFDQTNNAFIFNMTLLKCDVEHNNSLDILLRWTQILVVQNIIFKYTKTSSNDLAILDKRFQFSNVYLFFDYWRISSRDFRFWNFDGFDLNILDELPKNRIASSIEISNSRFDFYHDKTKIESCEDITNMNLTKMRSIFQLSTTLFFTLRNMHYKNSVCPLVFQNSENYELFLFDLVDTFYKRSILKFHNNTYPNLNNVVKSLAIYKAQNINLDLNLLHPSVFNTTGEIMINSRSLNSISGEIFKYLNKLCMIMINRIIFKKINHKQGIEWIKQWNYGINENLSNITNGTRTLEIRLISNTEPLFRGFVDTPISTSLPDEDFCLYVNFPFNQLVIVYEPNIKNNYFSCTYLWLVQYYEYYYKYFIDSNRESYSLILLLNTPAFIKHINESNAKCDFENRLSNCNKSNYHRKDIWDENDFFILNKKIQIAFKISLYPISLFGLITNFIVVLVILRKKNSDLLKEFKQYNYLYLNSVYCMIITVIELLSWMTECFYPFEVFCPEIRKLVAIQFFKIIFQECFVTMLRFMCNFTYIAFSLNRISLIGKDHGKLVTFMSEIGIKKYIGITFLISCLLSWIKGFKYEINYFYSIANYPTSNELDIIQASHISNRFVDFYYIFNSITDLVNYLVFVVICIIVDICMVVQLRRTLKEKLNKSTSMHQNLKTENKKAENEEAVNKAIKMVVLNSSISIFFKLPVFFIPLVNICAQFHFKDLNYYQSHTSFGRFYSILLHTGFYFLIQDMSKFFFTFSLSIQMFIYNRFDKKFNLGYERLKEQFFAYLRKRFNSSTESTQEKDTSRK